MTYLKAEIAPSPFTSAYNVDECMKAEVDEEKKNEHLNIEVMYARVHPSPHIFQIFGFLTSTYAYLFLSCI